MKDEIYTIISEELGVILSEVSESTRIEEVAHDSIDVIGLIAALSSRYNMRVEPQALAKIKTVGDIVMYVEANQNKVTTADPYKTF